MHPCTCCVYLQMQSSQTIMFLPELLSSLLKRGKCGLKIRPVYSKGRLNIKSTFKMSSKYLREAKAEIIYIINSLDCDINNKELFMTKCSFTHTHTHTHTLIIILIIIIIIIITIINACKLSSHDPSIYLPLGIYLFT